jgi:GNAT superfamily N-acetyltransferase
MTAPRAALIRPARTGDLRSLLDLYRHLHPDEQEPDPSLAEAAWTSLLASGLTTVFLAELAGGLVASCTLAVIPNLTRGGRPYAVIENVVTHADHRRAGLGQAVLAAAVAAATAADCYKICLATGSQREETLRFYARAGFTRGGKTYFEIRRP